MPQYVKNALYPLALLTIVIVISFIVVKPKNGFKIPWFKSSEPTTENNISPPPKEAKIPVLLYHYVEIVTDKGDFIRKNLAISPTAFENQLISLKNSGYSFSFVRDIDNILNRKSADNKPVIITFDDGYGDFYTDAFPILKRQNAKVTVFINSGLMGKLNYMTLDQVKEIAQSGLVEIGGHGYSHQSLTSITAESAKEVVTDDIYTIEHIYGVKPVSFAYPYGFYNAETIKLIKENGYKYAVTLKDGVIVHEDALLEIPRIRPGQAWNKDLGEYLNSL